MNPTGQSSRSGVAIAVVPARGGSKGIPRKNLALIDGTPMVAYSIRAGLECPRINEVLVSTDDEEIGSLAEREGAAFVPRPEKLSGDSSPTEAAVIHAMDWWKGREGSDADWVVLLQPTAPLRVSSDIDQAFKILDETKADSLLSVTEKREFHWSKEGDFGSPRWDIDRRPRRQELEPDFVENGAIYITRSTIYRERENRLGGKIALCSMPPERSIDVDDPFDLWLVEQILRRRKREK